MVAQLREGSITNLDQLIDKLSEDPDFGTTYGSDEVRACFWSFVEAGKARYSNTELALT